MDSPPRPHTIPISSSAPKRPRIPFPSPSDSSSQAAPDLPYITYISGLPPINSTNRVPHPQRFSETDLPPPSPLFSLPRMDLRRESSLPTSSIAANSNVHEPALDGLPGDSRTMIASMGCQWVGGRLNNRPDVPTREVNGLVHSDIFGVPASAAQHREQLGPQIVEACEDGLRSTRTAFKGSFEGAGQPQRMYGYLQFEIAGACHPTMTGNCLNSWRPVNKYANSRLPESVFSSQQRGIFRNQPLVSNPARHFQSALCVARTTETLNQMARSTHHAGDIHILAPGNMFTPEVNDMTKHIYQISPRKTRKRAKHSTGNDDGKHCRCRKSRCLKLYCECFAQDKHCSDSCKCSDCCNNDANDDKVEEIRCQIQSRNPQAFDPKIVNSGTDTRGEAGNWTAPSSGRHRRGCNCKKSTCQKKYCECYQAKVGCSDVCRCEGCRNCYGRQADRRVERREVQSHGRLNMGSADKLSPTWERITDISQISPFSYPHTEAGTFAALPNPRALYEVLHAPLYNSQTSAGSSNTPMSQLPENEVPPELSSDSARHASTEDDEKRNTLISSPSRPPSPPHNQLNDVARYSDLNLLQND